MKKVICLFSAFLLLLSSAITTYVHETDSQDYLSIPSYNETYSAHPTDNNFLSLKEYNIEYSNGENPLKTNSQDYLSIPSYNKTYSAQPTDNNFLSLKEYNAEYSNRENPLKIDSPLTTQNVPDICAISPIRKQTKSIILANQQVKVGTVTLQYQTDIKGGRPQCDQLKYFRKISEFLQP